LLTGGRGEGGDGGAKSNDGEKAKSSIKKFDTLWLEGNEMVGGRGGGGCARGDMTLSPYPPLYKHCRNKITETIFLFYL
jgi:hypothetical protein